MAWLLSELIYLNIVILSSTDRAAETAHTKGNTFMSRTLNSGLALAALAALGLGSTLPAAAQTVIITGASATGNPGTNLTAVGTTDWAKWGHDTNTTTFIAKSSTGATSGPPVGLISDVTAVYSVVGSGPNYPVKNIDYDGASLTWSDGYNYNYNGAQTSAGETSMLNTYNGQNSGSALGLGFQFTVTIPALTQGTFYLYDGGYNSTDTLSVTSSDGSLPSSMTVDNATGGTGYFTATINNILSTANIATFTFYESASDGDYDNAKLQAGALSLSPIAAAPEPSSLVSMSLAALGLGGLILKARKRTLACAS